MCLWMWVQRLACVRVHTFWPSKANLLALLQVEEAVFVPLAATVDEGSAGLGLAVEVPSHCVSSTAPLFHGLQARVGWIVFTKHTHTHTHELDKCKCGRHEAIMAWWKEGKPTRSVKVESLWWRRTGKVAPRTAAGELFVYLPLLPSSWFWLIWSHSEVQLWLFSAQHWSLL